MNELESKISQAAKELAAEVKRLAKLRDILKHSEKNLAAGKRPLQTLRKLAADLKSAPAFDYQFSTSGIATLVDEQIAGMAGTQERALLADLRASAETAGLAVARSGDDLTLGPFLLKLVTAQDVAKLEFAKIEVATEPLDAGSIVSRALTLRDGLLAPPDDTELADLADELEEAVRVSVARKKNPTLVGELRAELPSVHREMCWIRNAARTGREKTDYPLARFVVELKSLISSEFNLERARRLKLETAVIENTGNSKKSIFIPSNLQQGWGEGTFFQAIVLLHGT